MLGAGDAGAWGIRTKYIEGVCKERNESSGHYQLKREKRPYVAA
jgi:hypothetical protein